MRAPGPDGKGGDGAGTTQGDGRERKILREENEVNVESS